MKVKERPFFDPDEITTHVRQMYQLDLSDAVLAYEAFDRPTLFLCKKQREDILKKYCSPNVNYDHLIEESYDLFRKQNSRMLFYNTIVFPDPLKRIGLTLSEKVLITARNLAHFVLGSFEEEEFLHSCKNSSGSSVGVNFSDTSQEAKFKSPISCNKGTDRWFKWYLTWDSHLRDTLLSRGPISFNCVEGSRATTVPKDNTKVRMICVEPTLDMFFQQGIMQMMVRRLNRVGLSLESLQVRHKFLASTSSITGKLATIDWSSASDCVSTGIVKWLLPSDWYYYADKFRSKRMSINGVFEDLNMFSTMGNATTFPIETLVFWTLAVATHYHSRKRTSLLVPYEHLSSCSVFGDDCIVPAASADSFISICQSVGFIVNNDKTFLSGPFRESCGGDYLHGMDVRPFYLKGPTGLSKNHMAAWLNIILNRTLNRSLRIWGPLKYVYAMQNTFGYLLGLFRIYGLELNIVPTYYPDDAGVKIGYDLGRFRRNYKLRSILPCISTDLHGTRRFRYYAFQYSARKRPWDRLRFSLKLKFPALESPAFVPVRRHGSYVVATGLSPAFHIV